MSEFFADIFALYRANPVTMGVMTAILVFQGFVVWHIIRIKP